MLYYCDPYNDEALYPRLMTLHDELTGATTRVMFDRSEKTVILFQEQCVVGRMVNNRIRLTPESAAEMFPQYAARIAELNK
jgi:hypothetical protein